MITSCDCTKRHIASDVTIAEPSHVRTSVAGRAVEGGISGAVLRALHRPRVVGAQCARLVRDDAHRLPGAQTRLEVTRDVVCKTSNVNENPYGIYEQLNEYIPICTHTCSISAFIKFVVNVTRD